jgi:quinol monooxygenase YgiN
MTNICTVVAVFTPKPEYFEEIKDLLFRITPLVHDEPGCEFYTMNEDVDGRLIQIEAWTTKQHWLDHIEQQTVLDILAGVEDKLTKDIEVYEMYNLPTGTSGKGVLAQAQKL